LIFSDWDKVREYSGLGYLEEKVKELEENI